MSDKPGISDGLTTLLAGVIIGAVGVGFYYMIGSYLF